MSTVCARQPLRQSLCADSIDLVFSAYAFGYVDDDPENLVDYLGRVDDLAAVCARFEVDRVVVAFSRSHPASMASALRGLPRHVTVDVVPRYYELTGLQASLGDLSGMPIICLGERQHNAISIVTKRAMDIAASAIGHRCPT